MRLFESLLNQYFSEQDAPWQASVWLLPL